MAQVCETVTEDRKKIQSLDSTYLQFHFQLNGKQLLTKTNQDIPITQINEKRNLFNLNEKIKKKKKLIFRY